MRDQTLIELATRQWCYCKHCGVVSVYNRRIYCTGCARDLMDTITDDMAQEAAEQRLVGEGWY